MAESDAYDDDDTDATTRTPGASRSPHVGEDDGSGHHDDDMVEELDGSDTPPAFVRDSPNEVCADDMESAAASPSCSGDTAAAQEEG
jgi:hypothetical protein